MHSKQQPSDISFKSVLNFRDIGGIHTDGGKKVKSGIIFRSANLDQMSNEDYEKFKILKIKTIIDLRAPSEWKNRKNSLDNINVVSLPLDFQRSTIDRIKPYLRKKNTEAVLADISADLYLDILDAALPMFRKVIEILLSPDQSPVLIHCHVGKDRTGIIVALILLALGADRQGIIDDYMKSNIALLPFFRRRFLMKKIMTFGFYPSRQLLHVVTLRKRNIEAVIDRITDQYGDITTYLKDEGFDQNSIKQLKNKLLV